MRRVYARARARRADRRDGARRRRDRHGQRARRARAPRRVAPRATVRSSRSTAARSRRRLIESELFGHVRGAFSGAVGDRKGLFEEAHGGTLFLDEIGELPLTLQAKLLRVARDARGATRRRERDEEGRRARHRGDEPRRSRHAVNEGAFREDLYYRLAVVEVELAAAPRATRGHAACSPQALLRRASPGEPRCRCPRCSCRALDDARVARQRARAPQLHRATSLARRRGRHGGDAGRAAARAFFPAGIEAFVPVDLPMKQARDAWLNEFEGALRARAPQDDRRQRHARRRNRGREPPVSSAFDASSRLARRRRARRRRGLITAKIRVAMTAQSADGRLVGRYAIYGEIASGGMATVHFGRLLGPVGLLAHRRDQAPAPAVREGSRVRRDVPRRGAPRRAHPSSERRARRSTSSRRQGELFLVMEYVHGESLSRAPADARAQRSASRRAIVGAIMSARSTGFTRRTRRRASAASRSASCIATSPRRTSSSASTASRASSISASPKPRPHPRHARRPAQRKARVHGARAARGRSRQANRRLRGGGRLLGGAHGSQAVQRERR